MPAPPQITKNAQWVIDNFGPESGLSHFGYDAQSVAYLDTFLDNQGESFRANEQSADRIVSLLGAFVGEAIVATYGGDWQQSETSLSIAIETSGQIQIVQPFHKVHKRLMNGQQDSLHFYYATFLPQVLAQQGPSESPPSSSLESGPKKPWWKIF
ncbi:MAG: hypothetical protein ACIAXF_16575 [Phycisphaerales bacterium JB063]